HSEIVNHLTISSIRNSIRRSSLRRSFLLISLSFLLWAMPGNAHAQASAALYATGVGTGPGAQLSALYIIDPQTGMATVAWQLASIHVYAGGLAYDDVTDTLYATGVLDSDTATSRLFT